MKAKLNEALENQIDNLDGYELCALLEIIQDKVNATMFLAEKQSDLLDRSIAAELSTMKTKVFKFQNAANEVKGVIKDLSI